MTAIPAVHDPQDAADLLRELFNNPPAAALELATPDDPDRYAATLRWLQVALPDLPEPQARLLRTGASLLLAEPAIAGYAICLLEDDGGAPVAERAVPVVAEGRLRGVPATATGAGDLHAMLLGLCARLGGVPPQEALIRDLRDPRYRDLALLLAATEPGALAAALRAFTPSVSPGDEYAVEALGRALREAWQRQGEPAVQAALNEAVEDENVPVAMLIAGVREALEPARLTWLTDDQRRRELDAIRRQASERPDDLYLRLRLDDAAREAWLARMSQSLEQRRR